MWERRTRQCPGITGHVLANGTEPSLKQLPKSDVADMEYFLTQLQLVLPAIGVNVFRPKVAPPTAAGETGNHRCST